MSKYITELNRTGESVVNVGLICKHWNDRFSIITWINDKSEDYKFVISGKIKGKILCKTKISKGQAIEIVSKLNLTHIKSSLFNSAGSYHSRNFIDSEIIRINKIKDEKESDLMYINRVIEELKIAK